MVSSLTGAPYRNNYMPRRDAGTGANSFAICDIGRNHSENQSMSINLLKRYSGTWSCCRGNRNPCYRNAIFSTQGSNSQQNFIGQRNTWTNYRPQRRRPTLDHGHNRSRPQRYQCGQWRYHDRWRLRDSNAPLL